MQGFDDKDKNSEFHAMENREPVERFKSRVCDKLRTNCKEDYLSDSFCIEWRGVM